MTTTSTSRPESLRRRQGLTEQAAQAAIDQACRRLRLPTIRAVVDDAVTAGGRAETLARDIPVEDTAAAVLNMKHGGICVIQGCTTAYPGFSSTFYIHGEKGTVVFNDEGILEWKFLDEADAPQRPDMGERVGGAGDPTKIGNYGHICLLRDIAQAVRDGRSPAIPPQEAALAVRVICSIYESTRTGRPIVF